MKKNYLLHWQVIFLLVLLLPVAAMAQGQVKGKITSAEDGLPMPGVNIVEKGTTNGTVTDVDGNFSINVST